jgi:hypothetical protein
MKTKVFACLLLAAVFQLSALAVSTPHVSFRCRQGTSTSALSLDVRNEGPDRLNAGTKVYYYYRTPQSVMSITGSHILHTRLDKGDIFSVPLSDDSQTPITECGCSLNPIRPTARTTPGRKSE